MKKEKKQSSRECFPFHCTTTLRLLAIAAIIVCIIAIIVSLFGIIREGIHSTYDALRYPFLIAVSIFGVVVTVSLLIRSQYVVENKTLIGILLIRFDDKNEAIP